MTHTGVKQDEPIRADQVDTASSSLATQKEDELLPIGVIELVNKLLPLVDSHSTVQTEVLIPSRRVSVT